MRHTRKAAWISKYGGSAASLEPLRQTGEKGAARAELRVAHANSGAVADLIDLIEQVEDVEPQLETLIDPSLYRLNNAQIHLLIAGQAVAVGDGAVGRPEAAAGDQIGGKQRAGRGLSVFSPAEQVYVWS